MSREELRDAIQELADSPHMRFYTLELAMMRLDLEQLKSLFDNVAEHYEMLHPRPRRRVPRNPRLEGGRNNQLAPPD